MRSLFIFIALIISFSAGAEISLTKLSDCVCSDEGTQFFELVNSGDAGPFTYLWNGPNNYTSTVQSPTDMTEAGEYIVFVTNTYGCTVQLYSSIELCEESQSITFEVQPNCNSNGGNTLTTVTGGIPPLDYEWSNGALGVNALFNVPVNVPAEIYGVTVTDSEGCSVTGEVEVVVPSEDLEIVAEVSHACNQNDGLF